MDTTEKNIIMLEKAEEIQEGCQEESGTWVGNNILLDIYGNYYHVTDIMDTRKCSSCGHEEEYISGSKYIWLPRQGQLQEMLNIKIHPFLYLRCMGDGLNSEQISYFNDFDSMEQLWLAFVMKEKYNKIWDAQKEDWVKLPNG